MTLRVCFPYNFKQILEYNKEKNTYEGLLGGTVGSVWDWARKVTNLRLETQADDLGIGVYREELGHYDGCIGELQMNRTDLILQMFPYPKDIPGVSQGLIWYETSLKFVSMYNKTELGASSQMLDSFHAFSLGVWSLCVIACLFMIMFLITGEALLQLTRSLQNMKPGRHLYEVLVHCTRCGEIDDGGLSRRLLITSASIHALLVVHYFCSSIKTELVVIKDPLVFHSYDDIIQRGAVPLFVKGMSYDTLFKSENAEPYSKKL